jgi:hypothetical protein
MRGFFPVSYFSFGLIRKDIKCKILIQARNRRVNISVSLSGSCTTAANLQSCNSNDARTVTTETTQRHTRFHLILFYTHTAQLTHPHTLISMHKVYFMYIAPIQMIHLTSPRRGARKEGNKRREQKRGDGFSRSGPTAPR